jgi:cytochrome c biogenesis protein CcmG/thiol:disulfide interchange protein DsbE
LPSTPSSDSAPDHNASRPPSRVAIAAMIVLSIAIPAVLLALILTHNDHHNGPSSASGVSAPGESPIDARFAKVGAPAPNFTLPSTTGSTVKLSSLRGHPVVLVFFASWCHPCEEELPVLQQFATDDGGRMQVVGVNFRDLASDSVNFVKRLKVTFPALLDEPSSPVAQHYGVRGIPQTVFIDAHGVVRGRVYGQTSRTALQPAIDDLLHNRDIRPI